MLTAYACTLAVWTCCILPVIEKYDCGVLVVDTRFDANVTADPRVDTVPRVDTDPVTDNPEPDINKLPVITALPLKGNPDPPAAVEFIVTAPTPLTGDIEMLVPATICVTPPFNAYEAVVANDADNTCILEVWDVKTYEEVAAFNAIIDDSTVMILLLNPPLTEVKAPLISVAIWAELLNRVGLFATFTYSTYEADP